MKKLATGSFEDAIVSASIALSATARREHPKAGDKTACRRFLKDYLPIICEVGWVAFGISGPMNFLYRRLDSHSPGKRLRTMPEMLYDVVRCTAVHEAGLPSNLHFIEMPMIRTGRDGELVLPIDVIHGLLMAIVASPKNVGEEIDVDPMFSFRGKNVRVNELWGKRCMVEAFLDIKR